ncbi:helix-turn-helix transcriptional regulator [Marinobacter salinisoli]|uniref:Helix-turn-helix transcriptional regulator n=1 Tax=Marinobacter salinisoli TaxID=2769486 RepID=A0ABX7MWF4_9GAMM|nr:helix-turn-helix transcriptional regulator [Marinobacter salinisoli]
MLLTGFGLGCLTCLFFIIARDFSHLRVGQVFLLLLCAATAYLVAPLVPEGWRWIAAVLQTAAPALIWALCQLIFAARPRFRSIWGFMALYSFLAPALARPLLSDGDASPVAMFFGFRLGQWFEYVVVLHGLYYIVRYWREDLVESRRRARLVFLVIVCGAVGIATISLNFGLLNDYSRGIIVSLASMISLICMVSGREGILELTQEKPSKETEPVTTSSDSLSKGLHQQTPEPVYDQDLEALNSLMQSGYFTTEKLTLKQLARSLEIPEYRVRKLINQTLGYRNFNDYINHLRIEEAAKRLVREPETPILNISLDVGYRTLSSFNRAFRDIMDTTPTKFREHESTEITEQIL